MNTDAIKFLSSAFAFPILVAIFTTKITYQKEAKKAILEKRVPLYSDIQNHIESLMYDSTQIFDIKYRKSVLEYKPQVELFASLKTKHAYLDFCKIIEDCYSQYQIFCEENDPLRNRANYEIIVDENGSESETAWITDMDLELYDYKAKKYRESKCPDDNLLRQKVDALYSAMRKDLGTNR